VETQETLENIKWDHDNPEAAAEVGIRSGVLLQLLVQHKFWRSIKKKKKICNYVHQYSYCFIDQNI
jgi:hypothetical protein